ncbi:M23 family metallopeptidase [Rossellomorea marisflavi]|uniref:M23 family metallopeptidase n=1 Tax=Rossellomorea marisflavi TaxID=189381 RepID=UPI003FA06EDD
MKYTITSRFGDHEPFRDHVHTGVDFKMDVGEPLKAIEEGVIHIKDFGAANAGKTIILETDNGIQLIYGHLSEFNVVEGQHVSAGDLIGLSGNTGFSTGAHLHFGVKEGNRFVDPAPFIEKIQHMNESGSPIPKTNIMEYLQQHINVLTESMKETAVNLIMLTDYSPVIKLFENLFKFIFFNF